MSEVCLCRAQTAHVMSLLPPPADLILKFVTLSTTCMSRLLLLQEETGDEMVQ